MCSLRVSRRDYTIRIDSREVKTARSICTSGWPILPVFGRVGVLSLLTGLRRRSAYQLMQARCSTHHCV